MKLLLFDIDGTLIRSDGAGRAALKATLEEMFGTSGPLDSYRMGGKTDARIITDLLATAGFESSEIETKLPAAYALMAQKAETIFPTKNITICPGAAELLTALTQHQDVILGLLTGNACITAPLKLKGASIDPDMFKVGAFGCDHYDRNQLPAIAMKRASDFTGRSFTGANTVIIGDTPADILCARAGKATAVAVASGWHSSATLNQYHPDRLFENLTDTDMVFHSLIGETDNH